MERSCPEGSRRVRMVASAMAVAAACLLSSGTAAAEDQPPAIGGGKAEPSRLSPDGGPVQLSVDISDDGAVGIVSAQVYGSDGSYEAVELHQGNGTTYYGTFYAPSNYSDSPVDYSVEVQAYDDQNNYSATTVADIEVEGRPQFDEPPYFGETQLYPTYLEAEGGDVNLVVEAHDNRGISEIFATVTDSKGASTQVPLYATDFGRFVGTWHAPANAGPAAAEYLVEAIARDDIGQEGRSILGTVTVAAPPVPPPPPSPGTLQPKASGHEFRAVKLGRSAHWNFSLRNLPRGRRGGPVSATVRVVGSPAFTIAGAGPEGVHVTLAPGQRSRLEVDFAPTVAGPQSATIEVVRDDGGQPGLATTLSGEGRPPRQRPPRGR